MLMVLPWVVEEARGIGGIVVERPVPSGERQRMWPCDHSVNNMRNSVVVLLLHGVGCSSGEVAQERQVLLEEPQPSHLTWQLDLVCHYLQSILPPTMKLGFLLMN